MKIILITKDAELEEIAKNSLAVSDSLSSYSDFNRALDAADGADLMILDMVASLEVPHKVAGYEKFARAKMTHDLARTVPLILISPPPHYELDFMTGWPDFVALNIRAPITPKAFRRALAWI